MAKTTITQFPAGQSQYRIEFDYLARPFVVVTLVNSSNQTQNKVLVVGRDYRFLSATVIEILIAQTGFDTLRIHRQTGTDLVVDFRDGSVLTANDLTNAELQAIHIAEEGRDQTVDLAKEYADSALTSATNAKNSENEARRIAESIKTAGLMGYITRRSFESGITIREWNEALLWEADGNYYRWDGTLPKVVPAGSTPDSAGGVGKGKWLSVGDATLRTEMLRGRFKFEGAESVYYVPNINFNTSVDNRAAAYAFANKIYIPRDVTIRVNLLPDDDVRKFVGEGKLIVKNQFYGGDMLFDVEKATNGNKRSVKSVLLEAVRSQSYADGTIGIVGDSITDGAWGKQNWSSPPLDSNRNLAAPVDYNHGLAGGSHSWCAHWQWLMNMVQSRWTREPIFQVYNASLSGAKLSDGWGYRNFDRGFFGNVRYGAKAPRVCILAMGWNDSSQDMATYRDQIDMFVRKAWGYGCTVGIVTVNDNDWSRIGFEGATKRQMCETLGIDYFNLGPELTTMSNINMQGMDYYYVKKEPQYDTTHPQELGQKVMGGSMFMQTLGEKYVRRVRPGDMINTSVVENFWDAVTYPSQNHLRPQYGKAGGTPKLNTLGYLPMAQTAGENVTFNTFVWCEEEDMSLTVMEPWTGAGKVGDNNHLRVWAPAGLVLDETDANYGTRNKKINDYCQYNVGKLASNYLGGSRTLTTYAGRLRKGLNQIAIVNGGALPTCWYPALKFGHITTDGITIPLTRLSISQSSAPVPFIADGYQFDDYVLSNAFSGRAGAMTTDGYIRQGTVVGRVYVKSGFGLNTYLALNLDSLSGNAILIGVASNGQIACGSWLGKEPTDWTLLGDITTKDFTNVPFTVWVYTNASGQYTFSIITDDGRVVANPIATTVVTSGRIGVFKRTTGSFMAQIEANWGFTNVG
ncbi:tail spike [Escherichia phage Pisces]|uniref:Tail spike n=1 Tax=Escherichia phage Pisces TaxID=2591102 RepID=A0A5B9N5V1_9CAUD|nr:tail spike [Escherichia phage Pisces]